MIMDVLLCIGPNDTTVATACIESIRKNIQHRFIVCIVPPGFKTLPIPGTRWVCEDVFPFKKTDIDGLFGHPERSGWYLQQLLKIYAPLVLTQLSDTYLIVDADVIFHRPATFFSEGRVLFNVGIEYHIPYFEHMEALLPGLRKLSPASGICHLMPMKRHIVSSLIARVESHHGKSFWRAFLDCVPLREYHGSGASEYEILFTFTHLYFPEEMEVRALEWKNSDRLTSGYSGVYEAVHWYMRHYA
jgi:Family of unknown function (DUF6492)